MAKPVKDYVTIIELADQIARHKSQVLVALRKYDIRMFTVRQDGIHEGYAVSVSDAERFLELRDADGFGRPGRPPRGRTYVSQRA